MIPPFIRLVLNVLLCYCCYNIVEARLEAAVVLPHGDFALDPTLLPDKSQARKAAVEVSLSAYEAGYWLSHHVEPDIIFLSTPHGIELTQDFALYLGSKASGSVWIGKDLPTTNATTKTKIHLNSILLEPHLTKELVDWLRRPPSFNVSGVLVTADDDSEDVPLHWGEVIPLMLIGNSATTRHEAKLRGRSSSNPRRAVSLQHRRHIVLSHPLRRYYTDAPTIMIPELLELGHALMQWFDTRPERIAVVISSDLSHTHRYDGPYGYSHTSAPFDEAVGAWATDPCQLASRLLDDARSMQSTALACGFTGLVLLHGMLCGGTTGVAVHNKWNSQVLVNRNATYYGMMVAHYSRMEDSSDDTTLSSNSVAQVEA